MKQFKYYKKDYEWCIIWGCNTDFSKYDYAPDISLYKRGNFRDYENYIVVKIRNIMVPESDRDKLFLFKTQREGLKFIGKFIKILRLKNKSKKLEVLYRNNNQFIRRF